MKNYKSEVNRGIVHLWDLPENKVYLNFSSVFKKKILNLAIEKSETKKKLAEFLSIQTCQISHYKKAKYHIPLKVIKKLSNFLVSNGNEEHSLVCIENEITSIKAKGTATPIKNPNFPINFNSIDGGIIISAAMHDGCISDHRFIYINNNIDLKKRVYESVKNLIGTFELDIRKKFLKFPKIIGLILISIGLKNGPKVMTNTGFPNFLLNTKDEKIISEILNQAISDDGYLGNKSLCISISVCPKVADAPQILLDDKSFFQKLKIDAKGPYFWNSYISKRYRRKTNKYYIIVCGRKNLICLHKKIQISHKKKNERLSLELNYQREQFSYGTSIYEVLNACLTLKRNNEKIITKNVSKLINRHERTVLDLIHEAVNKRFLREIVPHHSRHPAVYNITKNGLKELKKGGYV